MRRVTYYLIIPLLVFCNVKDLFAQESKFQALYLYNFTKYMDWKSEQIVIGVLGNTPVLEDLEKALKQNPKIQLLKLSGVSEAKGCNMIFIPRTQNRNFTEVQSTIGNSPIVLVAENEALIRKGAEMAFYVKDNKLRFIVNKPELDKTGIQMSNTLLAKAKIIE